MEYKILAINPGSTSTKVSLFIGGEEVSKVEAMHDHEVLEKLTTLDEQLDYRYDTIVEALASEGVNLAGLSAVACRGGCFGRIHGGAYKVEENLLYACKHPYLEHASNYAAILGYHFAQEYGCDAYIYDAVCTDEITEVSRITGFKEVKRTGFSHTLNTKAVARAEAAKMGIKYEDGVFIVVHMGGGASTNIQVDGKIIETISDDEGAFSLERGGRLATRYIIEQCFSGQYTQREMMKKTKGKSGVVAHLGTKDMREIEQMINDGNEEAKLVIDAMAYQFARDIGSLAPIVRGKVDRIILTGGCAYRKFLTDAITEYVDYIAPVVIYPGALEMQALCNGITRVLDGEEDYRVLESPQTM